MAILPLALAKVLLKTLAKGPEARYLTASGFLADLLECRAQWHSTGTILDFEPGRYDAKARLRVSRQLYGRDRETAALLEKAQFNPGRPPGIAAGQRGSRRGQIDTGGAAGGLCPQGERTLFDG